MPTQELNNELFQRISSSSELLFRNTWCQCQVSFEAWTLGIASEAHGQKEYSFSFELPICYDPLLNFIFRECGKRSMHAVLNWPGINITTHLLAICNFEWVLEMDWNGFQFSQIFFYKLNCSVISNGRNVTALQSLNIKVSSCESFAFGRLWGTCFCWEWSR